MDNKTILIQELDNARAQLRAVLEPLDQEREIYPGWTKKHLLAHIAGWDDVVVTALRAFAKGEEHKIPAYRGIDEYNERSVEAREMLSHKQVHREFEQAREQVKELLRGMPDDKFMEEYHFPWGGQGTIRQLVGIFIHHETYHAEEVARITANNKAG